MKRNLIASLNRVKAINLIISGEGISTLNGEELKRLISFLSIYSHNIKVIAYLRDPISFFNSNFHQGLKQGDLIEHILRKKESRNTKIS